MAKGKKTGGKNFAVGNNYGRPSLPEDLKAAKKLTRTSLEAILNKFIHMDKGQLDEIVKNSSTTALEHMIVSIIHKALIGGDQMRLDFLLNRLIGRVKEQVEISMPKPTVIKRSDGTETVLGFEKRQIEE